MRAAHHPPGVAAILLAAALMAALFACGARQEMCRICERETHLAVRSELHLEDGGTIKACCPRCALHFLQETDRTARSFEVSDYAGGGMLAVEAAFLIEGSDETPCLRHHPPILGEGRAPLHVCYDRCRPSLIAFRDEAAARAFASAHGGTLHHPGRFPATTGSSPGGR